MGDKVSEIMDKDEKFKKRSRKTGWRWVVGKDGEDGMEERALLRREIRERTSGGRRKKPEARRGIDRKKAGEREEPKSQLLQREEVAESSSLMGNVNVPCSCQL